MSARREDDRLGSLYRQLHQRFGRQGWWPVGGRRRPGFDTAGYHPGLYEPPCTPRDRFEVIVGAVLTQNTAWTNVARALNNLRAASLRLPQDFLRCRTEVLARLVRPSGYFNQKAARLKVVARFFSSPGSLSGRQPPAREELLAVRGIGPETADSILLYAFHVAVFVVDAYTRRILQRMGVVSQRVSYAELQELFHAGLRSSERRFNEFHALLVALAKETCTARDPRCSACPVAPCVLGDVRRQARDRAPLP